MIMCLAALMLVGCREKVANVNKDIDMEAFSSMRTPSYILVPNEVRHTVDSLCYAQKPVFTGDRYAVNHYLQGGGYLWIDRSGVDLRADTLLSALRAVGKDGFSLRSFFVDEIEADLSRIRNLNFDEGENSVGKVLGRLEFHLTKACFRYVVGMRFGFVNPTVLFNRIDTIEGKANSPTPVYRTLFDIDIQHPGSEFAHYMVESISAKGIAAMIESSLPKDSLYMALQRKLAHAVGRERIAVLCNMERCRWRMLRPESENNRRVVVNIPAFHLYAIGGNSKLDMRVGCGSRKTKTPLLVSDITRMDVNPVWNIPMSIIRKDIVPKAADTAYFSRNRYYVVERKTGERIAQLDVTPEMLESGDYRVIQQGGEGNSLGRIIFRFPNDFSVFLHDTSSKGVFARDVRSVSHGCVRVQKPFELASFLLGDVDEWTLDKLRISMGMKPETPRGERFVADNDKPDVTLVRSLKVEPNVPLYIIYYTMYWENDGVLRMYNDIYGFDKVIFDSMQPLFE